MDNFFKKEEIDVLKRVLKFLEKRFGYTLIKEEVQDFYLGKNLLIYRNDQAQKQLEVCATASEPSFFLVVRSFSPQGVSGYNIKQDHLVLHDLAVLDNPAFNVIDFTVHDKIRDLDFREVTQNVGALLQRHEKLLTTSIWIVQELLSKLKSAHSLWSEKSQGLYIGDRIRQMIQHNFKAFQLVFDSFSLPPYHEKGSSDLIIYEAKGRELEIKWEMEDLSRDDPFKKMEVKYTIFMDGVEAKEVSLSENKAGADAAMAEIKAFCQGILFLLSTDSCILLLQLSLISIRQKLLDFLDSSFHDQALSVYDFWV